MPKRPGDTNKDDSGTGTLARPKRDLETLEKRKVERPPLYEVLLHNDDYTTQEFVVYVLMKYFQHDAVTARKIMLHVHTKGSAWPACSRSTSPRPRSIRWCRWHASTR